MSMRTFSSQMAAHLCGIKNWFDFPFGTRPSPTSAPLGADLTFRLLFGIETAQLAGIAAMGNCINCVPSHKESGTTSIIHMNDVFIWININHSFHEKQQLKDILLIRWGPAIQEEGDISLIVYQIELQTLLITTCSGHAKWILWMVKY